MLVVVVVVGVTAAAAGRSYVALGVNDKSECIDGSVSAVDMFCESTSSSSSVVVVVVLGDGALYESLLAILLVVLVLLTRRSLRQLGDKCGIVGDVGESKEEEAR